MNAGQMMMQAPVNATLPVAIPATPAMVSLQAGEQQASDFAGVLAGMTPQGSSRPGQVTGTAKPVVGGTPAAKGISLVSMKQDVKEAIVAALQTTTAQAVQTEPSDAGVSKNQAEPVEEKVTGDDVMPQNVVQCASGALVAAELQINGRMPEQNLMVASRGGVHDKATVVGVVDELKSIPVAGRILEQSSVGRGTEAPEKTALTTTLTQAGQASAESVPVRRSDAAEQALPPVELPEQISVKKVENADVQPKVVRLYDSASMTGVVPANQPQVSVSPEQIDGSTGVKAIAPAEPAVKGVATEPLQTATTPIYGPGIGEQPATATVDQAVRIAVVEATVVSQGITVQQRVAVKKEANVVAPPQGSDAGLLDPESKDPAAHAIPSHAIPSLKELAAVYPSEFRLSRSVVSDSALGGSRQVSGQTMDKDVSGHEYSNKMAVEQQLKADTDGGFSGSDSGSTAKDFEGFVQQSPLLARPAEQNIPGAHQQFSIDATTTNPPQALQSELSRPGSSDHISGQVRDQLATHEIKTGSEQITIRLSPEHLGDIKVNFRLEDQHLKVEIVAENRFAKESLLQHADSLKESLARQNISMDKFEVTTGGSSTGSQGNNAQGEWRELAKNRQSQQWLASGGYRTPSAGEVQKLPVYLDRTEHAVLDLHF